MDDQLVVLDAIHLLVSPVEQQSTDVTETGLPAIEFNKLLKTNLEILHQEITTNLKYKKLSEIINVGNTQGVYGIKWTFVGTIVKLLKCLKEAIDAKCVKDTEGRAAFEAAEEKKPGKNAPKLSDDVLSFAQQKIILTAIQFLVCLGICPNLVPGLGLPLKSRSEFASFLVTSSKEKIGILEMNYRLFTCIDILLECIESPSLGSIILSRHLGDILAGLLQISYAPIVYKSKPTSSTQSNKTNPSARNQSPTEAGQTENAKMNTNPPDKTASHVESVPEISSETQAMNLEDKTNTAQNKVPPSNVQPGRDEPGKVEPRRSRQITDKDKDYCKSSLSRLLNRVYQPMVIRELMLLQGSSNPKDGVPKTPNWLRKICGKLLTEQLLRPNGVAHVIKGMLDTVTDSSSIQMHQKTDVLGVVIATCPPSTPPKQFYSLIAPQILSLLNTKESPQTGLYIRIVCVAIETMLSQQQMLAKQHVIEPLLGPILQCMGGSSSDVCSDVTSTVLILHKLLQGARPGSTLYGALNYILSPLFQLHVFTQQGISHIKICTEELLIKLLKELPTEKCAEFLLSCARSQALTDFPMMDQRLDFANGCDGGVVIATRSTTRDIGESLHIQELRAMTVVALLKTLKDDSLTASTFIAVLQELTKILSSCEVNDQLKETLYNEADKEQELFAEIQGRLATVNLIAMMCDELGHSCLRQVKHVVQFVKFTLERGVRLQSCDTDEDLHDAFECESVTLALSLLMTILGTSTELTKEDKKDMNSLLPLLQTVSSVFENPKITELANDLAVAIGTQGAAWSKLLQEKVDTIKKRSEKKSEDAKAPNQTNDPSTRSTLVEELAATYAHDEEHKSENTKVKNKTTVNKMESKNITEDVAKGSKDSMKSKFVETSSDLTSDQELGTASDDELFQQAVEELKDPLVPVQGHALISLTRQIQKRTPATLCKQDWLFETFKGCLKHDDTYIYLSAINGLVSLSNSCHDKVVPLLVNEFSQKSDNNITMETRIKLGEALVKSTRSLGELIPMYRDLLINTFLNGAKNGDSFVRASSLSNLGEVCKLLRFSLGSCIQEIISCCSSILKSQGDEIEVRRAAAMVITMILQGGGSQAIQILENELQALYRLMKHTITVETDEQIRLHVAMGLEEMDKFMRDYLFPKQTLTKKIQVLSMD
ncbi:unnamed protein product [Owenia fusiformis]|uniref:Uncharacterized protein n=1 Tax=Owenia fusiformis TaxID=6347 RepID=A0A8J1URU4_OWEFU|nr:unnamed protein product [Owenia fusiformis]